VVGSRHRGELASIALGSVGHTLIRRRTVPVAVVHGWDPDSTETLPAAQQVAATAATVTGSASHAG
jgi:hypothetical protein